MAYIVYANINGNTLLHSEDRIAYAKAVALKIFYLLPTLGASAANGFKVAIMPRSQFKNTRSYKTAKVHTWYCCEVIPEKNAIACYTCKGDGTDKKPVDFSLEGCGFSCKEVAASWRKWVLANINTGRVA